MQHDSINGFEKIARWCTNAAGSTAAFVLALLIILGWLVTGPIFQFSDTWQLVINTGTTIITFLMVFLIQRSQNKESLAVHLKLNEIVAALQGASNRLINVEDMSEAEVNVLHGFYGKLADLAKRDQDLTQSHSVEEADDKHEQKRKFGRNSEPEA